MGNAWINYKHKRALPMTKKYRKKRCMEENKGNLSLNPNLHQFFDLKWTLSENFSWNPQHGQESFSLWNSIQKPHLANKHFHNFLSMFECYVQGFHNLSDLSRYSDS